jgi:hypothetical protein
MSLFINTDKILSEKIFPNLVSASESFQFGLEAEFLLVDENFKPLWHQDLSFEKLNELLEGIPFEDIKGRFDLFHLEAPAKKLMPFVVEGYHLPDKDFNMVDVLPKGLEIRTPVYNSIEETLDSYKKLFSRMQNALEKVNLKAVSLSHHPKEWHFEGPCNKRRYDYWIWAMEVMTTYGPDINVSIPASLLKDFDKADFELKVNYYAPAFTAVSAGSPFFKGDLWKTREGFGKSYRTHKRSIIAPPIEFHGDEENRFEFKVFDMTPYSRDFHAYFLLFLILVLDKDLKGRSDKATRIYEMGEVARLGLDATSMKERLKEVLDGRNVLAPYGFDLIPLKWLENRIENNWTLADEIISLHQRKGSIKECLEFLSTIK